MDKNLIVNGDVYGVANAEDGANIHQKIILPEHKAPTQLTSKLGKDTIIGRAKELQEINTLLKESCSLLLINGIGGIGKSTIASYYLHSQKENLDYYGFFEGLESFTSELREPLALQQEKENDAFLEALTKLRKLKGNKLLVFDDVKDIKENKDKIEKLLALKDSGYKILLTSRNKMKELERYTLPLLTLEDAKKLFLKYYETDEINRVEQIVKYLDYHALFIELLSKIMDNEGYSLKEIIEKFEQEELSKIEFIDEEDGDEISFNQNLKELFEMQKESLDKKYMLLIKQLSILPSIDIELSLLESIFGKSKLKGRLNFLVNKGWLIGDGKSYKLHQLIKEFLLANHAPCFEEAKNIIDYCSSNEVKIEEWISIFLESVAISCERCQMKDKKVGDLYSLLGTKYYDDLANRKKSKKYLDYAKELYTEVGEKVSPDIYHRLGDIDNNLDYLNKALSQYEKENNEKQKAICLSSIGTVYWNRGSLDKALSYFEKELELLKENDFTYLAINYNQQSLVYKDKRDIDKAFKYQEEAISLLDPSLIKKSIERNDDWFNKRELSQFVNNLGELYMDETEEFDLALKYIKESLDLREKNLYEGHERFGESYDNLAIIEEKRGNINEAYDYQLKAIKIWENSSPEKDIYLEEAKERLKNLQCKRHSREKR